MWPSGSYEPSAVAVTSWFTVTSLGILIAATGARLSFTVMVAVAVLVRLCESVTFSVTV